MKVRYLFLFSILCTFTLSSFAAKPKSKSAEQEAIDAALEQIGACNHWGGETGDQTEERNEQIAQGMEKNCAEADREIEFVATKYPTNRGLVGAISYGVDSGTLDGESKAIQAYCSGLVPTLTAAFKAAEVSGFYKTACPKQAESIYGKSE